MQFSKIIVLGSNSFTGGHFIDHILKNSHCEIIGISRSPEYHPFFLPFLYRKERPDRYTFCQLDVNKDLEEICSRCDDLKPDVIVNFAAQGEVRNSWKWPLQWYKTNCISVVRLTEHLKTKNYLKKYVAVSTPEVYGTTSENIQEGHEYYPSTPYATSKLAGELHLFALYKHYNFPVVFTRSANLYGIHQQLYRIIPRTIIYLKLGKTLDLHGRGEVLRSFIHARDVADLTYRAILNGENGGIYHFASDDGLHNIANVVQLICELMGYEFRRFVNFVDENYGQDSQYSLDATKAKKQLGWKQRVAFADGIKETINWIEENWEFIRKQPLEYIHKD